MRLLLIILAFVFFSSEAFSKTILVMGDSLTEGFRLGKEEAFPHLVEEALKAKLPDLKIINGGVSGSTSASALRRLDWYMRAKPEWMILALGANDGLRGVEPTEMERNLEAVILRAKEGGIKVILAGMRMPPNYGTKYTEAFDAVFPRVAKKHQLHFIPFLLDGVAGNPKLNLPDGIHPNPEGHKVISKTIIKYLEPLL